MQARGPQLAQQEFPSLGGGAAPDKPAAAVPQPVPTHGPHSNGPSSLHGHRAQDPVANWQPSRGDMQGGGVGLRHRGRDVRVPGFWGLCIALEQSPVPVASVAPLV